MSRLVATVFGTGYLRPAPGTWGSAVAIAVGLLIDRVASFPGLALMTALVIGVGFWAVGRELADKPGEDPSEFVIDEVAGQWIALLFPSAAFWARHWDGWMPWPAPLAAFLLFRLFDIWKPWLVGAADARGDAAGVMLDDLLAGLFAGICVIIGAGLYHGFLL